jgi:hypothetical protein
MAAPAAGLLLWFTMLLFTPTYGSCDFIGHGRTPRFDPIPALAIPLEGEGNESSLFEGGSCSTS